MDLGKLLIQYGLTIAQFPDDCLHLLRQLRGSGKREIARRFLALGLHFTQLGSQAFKFLLDSWLRHGLRNAGTETRFDLLKPMRRQNLLSNHSQRQFGGGESSDMIVAAAGGVALLIPATGVIERVTVRDAIHQPAAVPVEDASAERILVGIARSWLEPLSASPLLMDFQQPVGAVLGDEWWKLRGRFHGELGIVANRLQFAVFLAIVVFQQPWSLRCKTTMDSLGATKSRVQTASPRSSFG